MEKRGIIKTTKYALINKRWHKTEEWTEGHAIINADHWREWLNFPFQSDAKLETNKGLMAKFTTWSPDGTEKSITTLLADNYEPSTFDRLNCTTDKTYNSLYKRAKEACQRLGINFDKEQAFISSGNLEGFYFPNNSTYRGVFFIKGNAIAIRKGLM